MFFFLFFLAFYFEKIRISRWLKGKLWLESIISRVSNYSLSFIVRYWSERLHINDFVKAGKVDWTSIISKFYPLSGVLSLWPSSVLYSKRLTHFSVVTHFSLSFFFIWTFYKISPNKFCIELKKKKNKIFSLIFWKIKCMMQFEIKQFWNRAVQYDFHLSWCNSMHLLWQLLVISHSYINFCAVLNNCAVDNDIVIDNLSVRKIINLLFKHFIDFDTK